MLCFAGGASDYVALVKAPELALITTIPADDAPGRATMSLDDQFCFVPNSRSDTLSVISMAKRKEIARCPPATIPNMSRSRDSPPMY